MRHIILTRVQAENNGSQRNWVKQKFVGGGGGRLRKPVKRGRLFREFMHDNVVYIRRKGEDVSGFRVCQIIRLANNDNKEYAEHAGTNHLAFIVQIFQTF